jgi:aryl-alcohol dehydrogenase-like predicted oxidoreductase
MMQRRRFLAAGVAAALPVRAQDEPRLTRAIARTGERIAAVGMGTWLTFDAGATAIEREQRRRVLERFFAAGGGLIDSSPMYGRAERLLGELLPQVPHAGRLFSATKVWTAFARVGPSQMSESLRLWGEDSSGGARRFDLMQVHNLLAWRAHLKTLRAWQEQGRFRYVGVTTSHGRKHDEMEAILRREPVDFMQITLNLADRSAAPLIELAGDRGIAVIVNRPFDGGLLFNRVGRAPLPHVARDLGCANWAQFFLKWILSYRQVTCTIPATTRADHMEQNMGALAGPVPTPAQRRQMSAAFDAL